MIAATSLGGLGALLSIVQMPGGVPVATVAIGTAGAKNAALLAARILALKDSHTARCATRSLNDNLTCLKFIGTDGSQLMMSTFISPHQLA